MASELLRCAICTLDQGRLHVRRAKRGTPSVHPIRGDEIRALRRLRRENASEASVFVSERGGPISPIGFHHLMARLGKLPRCHLPCIHTCFAMLVGSSWPMMATTRAPYSTTSATRTSSTPSDIPKCHLIGSGTSGETDFKRTSNDNQ